MRNILKVTFIIILLSRITLADSPLTSTPFHDDYTDVDIVLKSEQLGTMNDEIAQYLHNASNPIGVKAAVINALGWEKSGNYSLYCEIIFDRLMTYADIPKLSKDDVFVIGYLIAMDNYLEPRGAVPFLKKARKLNRESFTVNIVYNLLRGQIAMEKDFCKVWQYSEKVFNNTYLDDDMRSGARMIIYDYIVIYKNDCK